MQAPRLALPACAAPNPVTRRPAATALLRLASGLLALAALAAPPAQAGRPLATDDAATAGAGNCQVEAWWERTSPARALHVSPACGIGDAIEINGEVARSKSQPPAQTDFSLGAKWVDPAWKLGPVGLGLKAWVGHTRFADGTRQQGENGAALLASAEGGMATLHLNLGALRDPADGRKHGLANIAVVLRPSEQWLAFAEANSVRHSPTSQTLGVRWWLLPEALGLDLTTGRSAGQPDSRVITLGLGWYNIKY
jgi:hypothetical protein